MNFNTWKALDPVETVAFKLGFDIKCCHDWQDYGHRFRVANDKDIGHLVNRARNIAGTLSSGELPVMLAMLHAADFSSQANEISQGETWTMLDYTYGDHAIAVALAIMRP